MKITNISQNCVAVTRESPVKAKAQDGNPSSKETCSKSREAQGKRLKL